MREWEGHWDLAAYLSIRRRRDAILRPLSRRLASRGVAPLTVSLAGVALAALSCWTFGRSAAVSLAAFLGALTCDALDGALARRLHRSRVSGKVVDHACDTATFLFVVLAIAHGQLASQPSVALAAALPVPLLAAAVLARRGPGLDREAALSGGILAHSFKVPVYVAFVLHSAGVAEILDPAVKLADAIALTSLVAVLARAMIGPAPVARGGAAATDSP